MAEHNPVNVGEALKLPFFTIQNYERYESNLPPVSFIQTRDGRRLSVRSMGPGYGVPVIRVHGSPGSSACSSRYLQEVGVRLIAFSRPGYEDSDRQEGRRVINTAYDIEDVMQAHHIERAAILAYSGGVAHALGAAAVLGPERIASVMLVSGQAPRDADIDWVKGMTPDNRDKHSMLTENGMEALVKNIDTHVQALRSSPFALLSALYPDLTPDDKLALLQDDGYAIAAGHATGLKHSGQGWVDDLVALHQGWGFAIADVKVPVTLFHFKGDPFTPADHSRWLSGQLQKVTKATYVEYTKPAHLASLFFLKKMLVILRDQYIGQQRADRIQRLEVAFKRERHQRFEKSWASAALNRDGYRADDYVARDFFKRMFDRVVHREIDYDAAEAARTVLQEIYLVAHLSY